MLRSSEVENYSENSFKILHILSNARPLLQVPYTGFLYQPRLRKPLFICFVMMMCNQLSGFTVVRTEFWLSFYTRLTVLRKRLFWANLCLACTANDFGKSYDIGLYSRCCIVLQRNEIPLAFFRIPVVFPPKMVFLYFQALFYSTRVLQSSGLSATNSELTTVGFEWFFVLTTLFCLPLVDRVGRRVLMLVGVAGMFMLNVLLTVFLTVDVSWFVCLLIGCEYALS